MENIIKAAKMLGIDAINKANSGHPGIVLGAAPMAANLFGNVMNINPKDPHWINRDRFVMSAGHGSALLYSLLHLSGYDLSLDDLKNFRQLNSKTPGHPENHITPGVDATSGPLGQGIAHAIGIALGQKHSAAIYNTEKHDIINHYTYAICGDGDLQEGVAMEAASLAGHLELDKLIILFDSNDITLDGPVSKSNNENIKNKFEAMNWSYFLVKDGNNIDELNNAITQAKEEKKPVIIEVRTVIGEDAPNQGTNKVHGSPLGEDGRKYLATKLHWSKEPFDIDKETYNEMSSLIEKRKSVYDEWVLKFNSWKAANANLAKQLENHLNGTLSVSPNWFKTYELGSAMATRASSGEVFNIIQENIGGLIGGSADLISSTKIKGINGDFNKDNWEGNNIFYGIREFAMCAVNNGIALHGLLRPFASGFFVFSDYAKPAIRLASLMETPSLYIFTHDSVAVGEDGPTHQPVEQIAGYRAQPNLLVFRPCDANEVVGSYVCALSQSKTPSLFALSRQNLETVNADPMNVEKGAYVISKEKGNHEFTLLASGSEVQLALAAKRELPEEVRDTVRVVSAPCLELFEKQGPAYISKILGERSKVIAIEMSSDNVWYKYARKVINMNSFGLSCPGGVAISESGFTIENIIKEVK